MADTAYHEYMAAGIRELHRLYYDGAPEEENPSHAGSIIGELLPIALIAAGVYVLGGPVLHGIEGLHNAAANPGSTSSSGGGLLGGIGSAISNLTGSLSGGGAASGKPPSSTANVGASGSGTDANGNYPWSVSYTANGALASLDPVFGIYWKCRHKNSDGTWTPPKSLAELTAWRTAVGQDCVGDPSNCSGGVHRGCCTGGWRLDNCAYYFADESSCSVVNPGC